MILLRDEHYDENGYELLLHFKNKQFDGEIYKAIVCTTHKFGTQSIVQEILWTQTDVALLCQQVAQICAAEENPPKGYHGIALQEQEFEALCFLCDEVIIDNEEVVSKDAMIIYVTVGIGGLGPTIRLTANKAELLRWADRIKEAFF